MTYEECVTHLPDELKALGYKIVNRKMVDKITNFHLDDNCQDCLFRIVHSNEKIRQCICYAQNIHSTDWKNCFYKDFNDTVYYNIIESAKRMVAQYKESIQNKRLSKLSEDF